MFDNAILLWGTAAGSIPIIIHLINRSRFRTVKWSAMHFLEQILRKQKRRLQIEQLILLLIRISIPVLLALCMALPILTRMEQLLGTARTSMIILMDNSYSMNAVPSSQSQIARARQEADKIIDSLPRGSEATIVWLSGNAAAITGPSFDNQRIKSHLAAVEQGFGLADSAAGLENAAKLLSKSHYHHTEVILISDFQKVSFADKNASARQRSLEQITSLAKKPYLTFLRVGEEVKENVAVDSLNLSRVVLGCNQEIRLRANIRNYCEGTYPEMRIYFRVDGEERSVSQISLGPNEAGQVLFRHSFDTPGSHYLEVYADADPLVSDNVKRVSIPVLDNLPVLLVSGDTNPEPLRSETAYLEIALQPFTLAKAKLADLIQARVVPFQRLDTKDLAARKDRVVVLANIRQLTDDQLKALEEYIREGGSLLIFPGDRINRDWYNSKLYKSGQGILPTSLGSLTGAVNQRQTPAGIVLQHYEHEALEFFNDPRNGSLGNSRIRLWYQLREPPALTRKTNIIAQLDTGDPFLVEKEFGAGRVILCCTACDADWSNLPMRPSYLPLMQRLITYLASKVHPPRNISVGDQIAAFLPTPQINKKTVLTDPEGKKIDLTVQKKAGHGIVQYDQTTQPGLYTLDMPDGKPIHFVVDSTRAESDLTLLNEKEFNDLAQEMNAQPVESSSEYLQITEKRRSGQPLWQFVLAATLCMVLLEILLQQWFAKPK
jgi:aerotolerance regulator-like protein/VWA domain-containing protein/CARDB protein